MTKPDYDDSEVEEQWCNEQQTRVARYLQSQQVIHGRIGDWPAWHLAPYVSIWAIESAKWPERVGWWAISGDLPTDYVSAEAIKHPRDAMRAIAELWSEAASHVEHGIPHPTLSIGKSDNQSELAPLLANRATLLLEWAGDDSFWGPDWIGGKAER